MDEGSSTFISSKTQNFNVAVKRFRYEPYRKTMKGNPLRKNIITRIYPDGMAEANIVAYIANRSWGA